MVRTLFVFPLPLTLFISLPGHNSLLQLPGPVARQPSPLPLLCCMTATGPFFLKAVRTTTTQHIPPPWRIGSPPFLYLLLYSPVFYTTVRLSPTISSCDGDLFCNAAEVEHDGVCSSALVYLYMQLPSYELHRLPTDIMLHFKICLYKRSLRMQS